VSALELANKLKAKFGELIAEPMEFRGEISLKISDSAQIHEVCNFAKRQLGLDYLVDITIIYHLRSVAANIELRLKTDVSEEKSEIASVISIWRTANWHEREIYDMMGVRFSGHPDLRRILMWEGYPYFPLRKDFPLAGKPTDLPNVAFTKPAPLEGGPFVTVAEKADSTAREPRVRNPEE